MERVQSLEERGLTTRRWRCRAAVPPPSAVSGVPVAGGGTVDALLSSAATADCGPLAVFMGVAGSRAPATLGALDHRRRGGKVGCGPSKLRACGSRSRSVCRAKPPPTTSVVSLGTHVESRRSANEVHDRC